MKFPENYKNNKNLYKPLKITHGGGYDVNNPDYGEKCKQIESHIDSLIKIGYGGIVTNVPFTKDYIEDETAKKLLKHEVEYCKKTGMRVWLYDEKGYPSGTAGGLTLRKNPDFEAKGLVGIFKAVNPGECAAIEFPKGHEKVVAAYAYNGTCFDDIDVNSARPLDFLFSGKGYASDLEYRNESPNPSFVAYFASKRLYEGTHAHHNVCESRRYIDLMNKDAVQEFIANTYEVYNDLLGEYFGDAIEAMFTDEPSCMAYYLNNGLNPSGVHDEYDDTIPLLPVVNWTNDFTARFEKLSGYNIEKYLPYVFGGNSREAYKIREDYHHAVSKFYEESFLCQVRDFCEKNNIAFSGHLLMEECMALHPPFEGNFFHQIKHMKYPGIDMLTTLTSTLMHQAQTPKLVASVAALNGREHVMSEVSSHIEGGRQTPEQMLSACVLQYALGIDIFTSYYGENAVDEQNYIVWNETLGRIAALMNGGTQKAKILLYYPIETANRNYLPQHEYSGDNLKKYDLSFARKNWASNNSWAVLSQMLLTNQLDYFMADFETLQKSKTACGKININENKNDFEVIILPACDITDGLLELIKTFGEKNIKVMTVIKPEFSSEIKKAAGIENLKICKDENELIMNLTAAINPDVFLRKEAAVVYMKKENENGLNYLFVNAQESGVKTTAELYAEKDYTFSLYNPVTDEETPLDAEIKGNKAVFDLCLPQYGFIIVRAGLTGNKQ